MANKKLNRDDVEHFIENDLYIPTRTIYIGPMDAEDVEVNAIMAERAIKNIHILDSKSDDPIDIILFSYGGDVTAGMAIYDAIRICRSFVTVKVFGCANSMGSIILQAADNRLMSRNSEMMIHYGEAGYASNHPKTIDNEHKRAKEYDVWMKNMYLAKIKEKKPRFQMKQLDKLLNFDSYFTPEKAIEYGLVDSIMEEWNNK